MDDNNGIGWENGIFMGLVVVFLVGGLEHSDYFPLGMSSSQLMKIGW